MSNELAVLNNNNALSAGGAGRTGTSRLLEVTPASLGIVQANSTKENAKKGYLIIDGDTELQFKEMIVTLLAEPEEQRAYYTGNPGEMNRSPENLQCFSRDMVRPDDRAKYPQAITCASCPRGSWDQFRAKRDKGIATTKEDVPPCDAFYIANLLDTHYKMPLRLYVRSQSKGPFEDGMKKIARKLAMIGATTGRNPNIFDVSFKLSTKQVTKGKFTFYVLNISDVEGVTDEQREAFGVVYQQYDAAKNRRVNELAEAQAENEIAESENSINNLATGVGAVAGSGTVIDDEITF